MHRWCLGPSSLLLVVVSAGCGGGDFVTRSNGDRTLDGGDDARAGAVEGNGGDTTGDGGSSSGSGRRSTSSGSGEAGGVADAGGNRKTGGTGSGDHLDGGPSGGTRGGDTDGGASGRGGAAAGGASSRAGAAGQAGGGANGAGSGGGGTAGAAGATGGACANPTTWYADDDQDGYAADTAPAIVGCAAPSDRFSKVRGDCDDTNSDVHPQLTPSEVRYFDKPYQAPSGVDSFDYDCSGHEDGDPSQPKAEASCPVLSAGACGGSGYLTVSTGNRVSANGYCGSRSYRTCVSQVAVLCSAQDVTDFPEAYRCK